MAWWNFQYSKTREVINYIKYNPLNISLVTNDNILNIKLKVKDETENKLSINLSVSHTELNLVLNLDTNEKNINLDKKSDVKFLNITLTNL